MPPLGGASSIEMACDSAVLCSVVSLALSSLGCGRCSIVKMLEAVAVMLLSSRSSCIAEDGCFIVASR